ncbi:DUF4194 domain-containing protein [Geodermatophilus sp. YIM 151500]|uniref:DUF4194 domain-containing protein n=1 Tax=Geodermatophilus sp. YIM 151500 TaxID=2984531 RepID=UPI0021E4B9F1|nr:DUF4194 domain-containing protein [Geodermatophilus sp. YIM 151500]MCV2488267.1 DUF4194 domain-containing protein [Geodermatophilus sp. YIM 151500]
MTAPPPARSELDLPLVATTLMKGVVYRDTHEQVWRHLIPLQAQLRDHMATLGLVPVVDEAEGYAFLRQRDDDGADDGPDDGPAGGSATGAKIPRLVARRSLSFPVSLLLALLRRRMAEFDATDAGSRLVLTREQIVALIRVFLPERSNKARLVDQVDAHIAKVVELGFLRRVPGPDDAFEVRRILKAFVDAQWLADFDRRLAGYAAVLRGAPTDPEEAP